MKKNFLKFSLLSLALLMGLGFVWPIGAYADEGSEEAKTSSGTSISLMPVSKILQISSNSVYDDTFTVNNDGDATMKIEVYAAPYSYIYSSEEDSYKLGFNNANNFTQISRWISFKNSSGFYAEKANFEIAPHDSIDISFRVSTPDNIPSGGQYAVIFAHTLTSEVSSSGIRTEASPGMIIYGRSTEGEAKVEAEISGMTLEQGINENGNIRNNFYGKAKVKNTGNIDFNAIGTLRVENIFGSTIYETPANRGIVSIIPEAELVVSDEWEDTPIFGLYHISWTVTAGEQDEVIEKTVFLISPLIVILLIIFLTILTIWIIIMVRKRKERRSRLAV